MWAGGVWAPSGAAQAVPLAGPQLFPSMALSGFLLFSRKWSERKIHSGFLPKGLTQLAPEFLTASPRASSPDTPYSSYNCISLLVKGASGQPSAKTPKASEA